MLEARTRMFSDRLSNTYVTVAGGNSNRLLVAREAAIARRPPTTRLHTHTDSSDTDSDRCATRATGNKRWGSWKSRLLKGRNHAASKQVAQPKRQKPTINGSVYSDTSRSCSPSLSPHSCRGADRDELEMTDVASTDEVPVHQVILLKEKGESGTYL